MISIVLKKAIQWIVLSPHGPLWQGKFLYWSINQNPIKVRISDEANGRLFRGKLSWQQKLVNISLYPNRQINVVTQSHHPVQSEQQKELHMQSPIQEHPVFIIITTATNNLTPTSSSTAKYRDKTTNQENSWK